MSVVHVIDTVKDWAQLNICNKIQLKQPPDDLDAPVDAEYDYKLVNPTAFAMYVPTAEKNSPNFHLPTPSLCIRFIAGQDELAGNKGFVDLQILFSTWDPGIHGEDMFLPNGKGGSKRWTGAEADAYFQRTGEGWRDAWNFVDVALRTVESVTDIGGYAIDRSTPIKYGPLTEQETIADLYPFWFAWISFRVTYPLMRNISKLNDFL